MMKNSLIKKSIFKVLKNNIGLSSLLVFTVAAVVITSLIPPQILKYIIDHNLMPKKSEKLLVLAASYIGVLLCIGIFDLVKEAVLTILGQKITKEIRVEMMVKLERISALFFSSNSSGAVVSRFTNDVDTINTLFTSGIVGMMIDCFKLIGIVISIWIFSSRIGVITLLIIPVIYSITRLFKKRMLLIYKL
jgi:ATP-binding cassette subfamily B protein